MRVITVCEYDSMLQKQNNMCAICGSDLDWGKNTHVDHDHKTNKVRALLCGKCNKGLGQFNDDSSILHAAANYVDFHKKEVVEEIPTTLSGECKPYVGRVKSK